jgi:hypothetical protein
MNSLWRAHNQHNAQRHLLQIRPDQSQARDEQYKDMSQVRMPCKSTKTNICIDNRGSWGIEVPAPLVYVQPKATRVRAIKDGTATYGSRGPGSTFSNIQPISALQGFRPGHQGQVAFPGRRHSTANIEPETSKRSAHMCTITSLSDLQIQSGRTR